MWYDCTYTYAHIDTKLNDNNDVYSNKIHRKTTTTKTQLTNCIKMAYLMTNQLPRTFLQHLFSAILIISAIFFTSSLIPILVLSLSRCLSVFLHFVHINTLLIKIQLYDGSLLQFNSKNSWWKRGSNQLHLFV